MATAAGTTIGALRVVIGADTTGFKRGMGEATTGLGNLRKAALPAIAAIAAVGAAATAVGVKLYSMARAEMNVIDAQAKLARSLDGTVTGLRALNHAANLSGVDGLESSLARLNRRLGATEMGVGPAADTVKRLGLNLKELASLDVDAKVAHIADAIRDSGVSSQEAARHLQNLGFQQHGVTELFMQGGDAIRAARGEIEDFGLSVSQVDAAKIEAANDAFTRLGLVTQGLKTRLAIELAPTLLEIGQRMANVAKVMMTYVTNTGKADKATTELGGNKAIINFAEKVGVALSKLIDWVSLLRDALNAFEGYAKYWATSTLSSIITPFSGIIRLGAKMNAEMFADQVEFLDNLQAKREEGWEQGKKGWDNFWRTIKTGQGDAERSFREAWGEGISPPGVSGGGGGDFTGGGGGKKDKEADKEREQLQQRLDDLRKFLATREALEVQAGVDRVDLIGKALDAGLISEQEHNQMLFDTAGKFYDAMAELREEKYQKERSKLQELNELGLLDDSEYHMQRMELMAEQEQQKTDALIEAYMQRRAMLEELLEESDLSDEERREKLEELEAEHQDELTRIVAAGAQARKKANEEEAKQRQQVMSGMMANLTTLMDSGNKEMFRIGKVAAVSQALVKGYQAVVNSYEAGTKIGGPVVGAAFAATAAAATAAQIAKISSTSFGSGGSPSASAGGGGSSYGRPTDSIPAGPAEPERLHSSVTINLVGESYSRQQVRDLIEQINEATADGAQLRLA